MRQFDPFAVIRSIRIAFFNFMEIRGWLFDLYPLDSSMILWIKEADGAIRRFEEPFQPRFYAQGKEREILNFLHSLSRSGGAIEYQWVRMREFWSGGEVDVMEIELGSPGLYVQLPKILSRWEETITFYNCDVPLPQAYLYGKGLFPTGWCIIEVEGNRIVEIHADPSESVWADDRPLPDLRIMELQMDGNSIRPRSLILECEGYRLDMDGVDLGEIERFLRRFDPDVILSDGGDASLFPFLFDLERKEKRSLPWDREPHPLRRQVKAKGYSYFSYGRTYYRAPAYLLFGRWHIDRRNSFIHGESDMEGLIELARLAKVPVQRMARTSPGTAITSMQLDRAFQDHILIPWRKGEPEKFKTAWDLLVADKGGLVFQPKLGIFEDIAEIDFASMYPTLMAIHNLSAETVLCECCENHRVPESGYTTCEKREGMVPKVLRPLLARRTWLKRMARELEFGVRRSEFGDIEKKLGVKSSEFGVRKEDCGFRNADFGMREGNFKREKVAPENYRIEKEETEKKRKSYERRQVALKWTLVTCFGYLGYRNARFGRIEAHEAVTAFGRETLLQAKEICEEAGFELLHAITDSLWIRKEGLKEEEVLELCRKISEATGVTMSLEGIYRWMLFLPSKGNRESPVANRYFGLFKNGKLKARGLAFRRGDMPPLIQEAQLRMLHVLAEANNADEYCLKIPEVLDLLLEYGLVLKDGRAKSEDLAIRRTISQEPNDYKVDSPIALAAQQLEDSGIPIHAGEKVRYVIKDAKSKDKDERVRPFPLVGPDDTYDVEKYQEMLLKAGEELLIHCGYDVKHLQELIDPSLSCDACVPKTQHKGGRSTR
jgi:DNA polymerase elongation subunit (family B)